MFAKVCPVQIFYPCSPIILTKSPPCSIPSLLVDRRKAFKDLISISRPVTMTMALVRKTNERPGAPVLTAKMSFSPIASPANVDGTPHYRCGVPSGITDNGGCMYTTVRIDDGLSPLRAVFAQSSSSLQVTIVPEY